MRTLFFTLCGVLFAAASQAGITSDGRFNLASVEQPAFTYEPSQPLWEDNPMAYKPYDYQEAVTGRSPLRVNGAVLRAPNQRKTTAPGGEGTMNRLTEQRLLDSYGTEGWEQMAIDGQLRLTKRHQDGLAPYVTGGMGVTQLSNSNLAVNPEANDMLGLRYGAGVAYTLGDELDLTAGYRVNRMDDSVGSTMNRERLNMQMLDFGLRYKY